MKTLGRNVIFRLHVSASTRANGSEPCVIPLPITDGMWITDRPTVYGRTFKTRNPQVTHTRVSSQRSCAWTPTSPFDLERGRLRRAATEEKVIGSLMCGTTWSWDR